jgi:hypothetical protein
MPGLAQSVKTRLSAGFSDASLHSWLSDGYNAWLQPDDSIEQPGRSLFRLLRNQKETTMNRQSMRTKWMLGFLVLIASGATTVRADIAASFTSVNDELTDPVGYSLGYNFIPRQTITVTALGDYKPVAESHDVGIYDYATQVLLTRTSVTTSDTKIGFFNYHDITPITLIAEKTYQIDAVTGTEPYTDSSRVSGLTYSPAIDVISGGYHYGGSLSFFTNDQPASFFGPNFEFTTGAVPEPSTLVIAGLGGTLLLAAAWCRRPAR